MKKAASWVFPVVVSLMILFTFAGCGKNRHISKILREEATEGSMMWLELIKEYGVNSEWDGSTLLGEAIKAGRVDMVEALIKDKADVNRPASYLSFFGTSVGIPPLQLASSRGGAADALLLGLKAPPEQSSQIRVLLLKAGAQVKTERFDVILAALNQADEETFNAALPKYNKKMLDFSAYGKEEYEAGLPPFNNIHDDERFEEQKPMLEKLLKKGIQFGFYDISKALDMYLNPEQTAYGDEFLYKILVYMAKQDGFNLIAEEPSSFNEDNPQYISPLDLAIHSIEYDRDTNTSTDPALYIQVIKTFGTKNLSVTTYEWWRSGLNSNYPYMGTLTMLLNIISQKINTEASNRARYQASVTNGREFEPNAIPFAEWTPEMIVEAIGALDSYGALYHSRNSDSETDPFSYFCGKIVSRTVYGKPVLPDIDIIQPYYQVFDKLRKTGYIAYGIKSPFVYEGANSAEEYFTNYGLR
jgi:hypothetical protein